MACARINFHSKARAQHAFTVLLYNAIHSFLLYYTQETKTQNQTHLVKTQHQQQQNRQTHSHLLKSIQFNSNPLLPSVTYRKQPRPIAFDSIPSKKIRNILASLQLHFNKTEFDCIRPRPSACDRILPHLIQIGSNRLQLWLSHRIHSIAPVSYWLHPQ